MSMLGVLLKAYMRQAAAEKEAGLVLGHSRGLLTWSNRFLEAAAKVRITYMCRRILDEPKTVVTLALAV